MSSTGYLDKLYESTFDSVYDALLELARKDPANAVHHIQQVLKSLYVRQGNDWSGRGIVGDTSINASIAAHESALAELAGPDTPAASRAGRAVGAGSPPARLPPPRQTP